MTLRLALKSVVATASVALGLLPVAAVAGPGGDGSFSSYPWKDTLRRTTGETEGVAVALAVDPATGDTWIHAGKYAFGDEGGAKILFAVSFAETPAGVSVGSDGTLVAVGTGIRGFHPDARLEVTPGSDGVLSGVFVPPRIRSGTPVVTTRVRVPG